MEFGCSSFTWETTDGIHLMGRTYDQVGELCNNRITVVPRAYPIPTVPGNLADGFTAQHSFVGMAAFDFGIPIFVDGINETGVMGALLNYPGYAAYPAIPGRIPVYCGYLVMFVLSQCASVGEIAALVQRISLRDERISGIDLQVHYMFSDRSGEAIVVEPGPDGLAVHRQTIGVLTNSPDYLWNRTNLRNYVGVTGMPKPPQQFANFEARMFGGGVGSLSGLPGGFSSPERFVRLAFTKQFAAMGEGEQEGVTRMFHNFAPVETPRGLLHSDTNRISCLLTLCITVMCAESLTYYFSPYENRRISAVRLYSAMTDRSIQYIPLPDHQDISYLN